MQTLTRHLFEPRFLPPIASRAFCASARVKWGRLEGKIADAHKNAKTPKAIRVEVPEGQTLARVVFQGESLLPARIKLEQRMIITGGIELGALAGIWSLLGTSLAFWQMGVIALFALKVPFSFFMTREVMNCACYSNILKIVAADINRSSEPSEAPPVRPGAMGVRLMIDTDYVHRVVDAYPREAITDPEAACLRGPTFHQLLELDILSLSESKGKIKDKKFVSKLRRESGRMDELVRGGS